MFDLDAYNVRLGVIYADLKVRLGGEHVEIGGKFEFDHIYDITFLVYRLNI